MYCSFSYIFFYNYCFTQCDYGPCEKDGKWGYVEDGEVIIPYKYDSVIETDFFTRDRYYFDCMEITQKLIPVKAEGKAGLIDIKGNSIIPCQYDEIVMEDEMYFHKGMAKVRLGLLYGLVDKKGRQIIPCKYEDITYFNKGKAEVVVKGKFGYVDNTGRLYLNNE